MYSNLIYNEGGPTKQWRNLHLIDVIEQPVSLDGGKLGLYPTAHKPIKSNVLKT